MSFQSKAHTESRMRARSESHCNVSQQPVHASKGQVQQKVGLNKFRGLDMHTLLAGLQRGTVPEADDNVAFLCQKFTKLMERLQRA